MVVYVVSGLCRASVILKCRTDEVILGTILGAVLGLAFSTLMKYSHRKGFIDRESYVAQYLALTIFTIGVASTIGSDDLLAAFAAGQLECAIQIVFHLLISFWQGLQFPGTAISTFRQRMKSSHQSLTSF
jgi:NhaP-type Na+/H+ or K+/H+ antiporter